MAETATERSRSGEEAQEEAHRMLGHARAMSDEFVDFLSRLVLVETPTNRPETIAGAHALLGPFLEELGYDVRIIPGRVSGDHLYEIGRAHV